MAVRTVSNTGGNWSSTTAWVGGVVPIAGDTVDFTATSGPLIVNVSTANLIGIDFTNYVNTITFSQPINTNGTVNLGTGGYTQAGTSGLIINGATTISGTAVWSRTFVIAGTTYIITLSNTLNITGQVTFSQTSTLTFSVGANTFNPTGDLLIQNGTTTLPNSISVINLSIIPSTTSAPVLNANDINISGNLTLNSSTSGMFLGGTTTLVLTGTGTWSHSGTAMQLRNNLTINSPSGTITISGNVYYNTGTLAYTTGTVTITGSTLNISASTTLNTSGITWNNVIITSTTTITLLSNLDITNLTYGNGSTTTLTFTLGGNILSISNNLTLIANATFNLPSNLQVTNLILGTGANASIVINGLFNLSVSGNLTQNHGTTAAITGTSTIILNGTGSWANASTAALRNNLIINTTGAITISGNIYYNTGTLTYTTGTVTTTGSTLNISATSTLNISGITWNNVTLIGTQTLSSGLNVGGNLTTLTTAVILSGVVNVNVSGNLVINIATSGTATIILNGTGSQTWSHGSAVYLSNNLIINKTSGTLIVSGNVYYNTGTLTYNVSGGTVTTTSSTLNIGGSTTLNTNGVSWNNFTCNVASTITLNSDLVWGGTMTLVNTVAATLSFSGTGILLPTSSVIMIIGQNNYATNAGNTIVNFPLSSVFNITSLTTLCGGASSLGYNCTMNNVTFNLSGNLSVSYLNQAASSVLGTSSSISMVGTGTITFSGTGSAIMSMPFTINTSGTYSFSGTPYFSSTVNYLLGTISGATCIFTGASLNLNPGGKWGTDVILQGSITLLSNATFGNTATSISGSLTLSGSFVMNVEGNLSINIPTSGVVSIIINGTGNQTWSHNSSGVLSNNLTINKPLGTLTIGTSFNIRYLTGTLTYTAGTVITTGSTLNIGGSTTLNTNGISWNNFTCDVTSTITLNSNFTCIGVVSLASSVAASVIFSGTGLLLFMSSVTMIIGQNNYSVNAGNTVITFPSSSVFNIISLTVRTGGATNVGYNCTINNATFNLSGNLSVSWYNQGTPTINGTNSLINMIGTGTINGSGTNAVVQLSIPITINTTGTITFSGTINISNTTITYTSGTLTGVTVVMNTCILNLNAGGVWAPPVALVGNTTLLSDANFTNLTTQTTAVVLSGLFNVTVGGNLTINITTSGTPNITLNGTGIWSATSYLSNNLTINSPLGTLTISGTVYYRTGTLLYTSGTVTTTNSTLVIGGTTTLNTNGINWFNLSTPLASVITLISNLNILNTGDFRYAGGILTFISSTGTLSVGGNLFLGTSNSVNIDSTITLCNDLTVQSLYISHFSNGQGGLPTVKLLTINNFTINASGNLTTQFYDNGTLNILGGEIIGTTNIVLNGTGTWVANNGVQYGWPLVLTLNLTINTLGTITVSGIIQYHKGTLTYISGSVITSGSTLYIISIYNQYVSTTLNTNNLEWNNILIRGGLTILLTSDITIKGSFTPTAYSLLTGNSVINGLFNINIKGTLQANNALSGTSTIQLNGVWATLGYNVFNNLSFNGNSVISGIVYYSTGILTYITGTIITKNSTLYLLASTLINCHKINFNRVVITSGVNITMNEFFSGSPSLVTIIAPSSTTNYTITFQDGFEKISKFTKISGCTLAKPMQLLSLNNMATKSTNRGIRYINQSPNGIAKNKPSLQNSTTFGAGGLVGDPNMR